MKLNKVSALIKQQTGVGWYRQVQPIRFLKRTGECKESRMTPFDGVGTASSFVGGANTPGVVWNDRTLMQICKDTDIIWTTLIYNLEEMQKIINLRKWSGAKWIVDIDDNMYAVPNDNPAKGKVEQLRDMYELSLRLADGVTVSVPMLKDVYKHLNKNIYIQKNGMDKKEWNFKRKGNNKKLRIGWRGAWGHKADLDMVLPVVERICKDYDVEFHTLGYEPSFSTKHYKWVSVSDFPKTLASMNLDIAITPLVDSNYNRCKSNINILEQSMLKTPVVASPTENQSDFPCLYARNNYEWYESLEKLIKSKELREDIGKKQYNYAMKHYEMTNMVSGLADWFSKLPRRSYKEYLK